MSSSNCCFLTYIQISQEAGQVVWYSHLFQNFPQFIVIHTVKGFGIVSQGGIDVFLELSCFFYDPASAAAAAKSLQSCPTLCDPIDGSPPGSPIPGILQARTLEWVAISFSNAWKRKVKVKLLNIVRLLATPWTAAYQAPLSMGFSRQEYWSGSVIQQMLAIWSLVPLPFLNPAWTSRSSRFTYCWSLTWTILNITNMWDECNCAVVWVFFGIAFLWDWNENWPFPVLWPLLSFPNLLAYWVQHFHSIIFQDLK